jgi:hypothetical protein
MMPHSNGLFWHQHFKPEFIHPYKVIHINSKWVGFYCVKAELSDQWSGIVMNALNKMMAKQ